MYYRLFADVLLPLNVSKILYLDADIIVSDTLDELWNTDITDCSVAVSVHRTFDNIVYTNNLDYDRSEGYFCSGVMVINLDYWRKHDVAKKALSFIKNNPEKCGMPDQDALNFVTVGTRKLVSNRYNMTGLEKVETMRVRKEWHDDIRAAQKNPAIIHFIGPVKPWHTNCDHPYKKLWFFVKEQTPWKKVKPQPSEKFLKRTYRTIGSILIKIFGRRFFEKLHLIEAQNNNAFYLENAENLLKRFRIDNALNDQT